MFSYLCCCFYSDEKKNNENLFEDYELYNELKYIEFKNTKKFIMPIKYGKVIKVYDGDTITICSKLPYKESPIYRFQVRLNGIDSPEIKGKTEIEKKKAVEARNALCKLILGKFVFLEIVGNEKYGRILADVYYNNIHINEWMVVNNYAVNYDGGKKKVTWADCDMIVLSE